MNKRQLLVCMISLAVAHTAHANPNAAGKLYTPGAFDSLTLGGSVQVQFRQGDRDEVFVEGDDEAQSRVTLTLRGTELQVRTESGFLQLFRSKQRARLQIVMRDLKSLSVSGAADVVANELVHVQALQVSVSGAGVTRFERLHTNQLRFDVSGAGDGYFTGQVDELSVRISGRSDFYGENLLSRNARITISGIGKAKIWAVETLHATVSGIGTVDYWGEPKMERRASGVTNFTSRGLKAPPLTP